MNQPFVADRPEFALLREDVRADVRQAETEFRAAMADLVNTLRQRFGPDFNLDLVPLSDRLFASLLPILRDISTMRAYEAALMRGRQVN